MRTIALLLLAAALSLPLNAVAQEYDTSLTLANGTGHFIYVDTVGPHLVHHWGLVAPNSHVRMTFHVVAGLGLSSVHVHVYVKSHQTEDARATICHTTNSYPLSKKSWPDVRATYDGSTCSIVPL